MDFNSDFNKVLIIENNGNTKSIKKIRKALLQIKSQKLFWKNF